MIRLSNHPADTSVLVLRIDQLHNAVIGSFQPARRQDDMGVGVYVMEADKLDSLRAWSRYQNIHLLDESRNTGPIAKSLECANTLDSGDKCCSPYRAGDIPRYCGTCGQASNPVHFEASEPLVGSKCAGCSRVVSGGPTFCPYCGTTMPERHLSAPTIARTKGQPRPLAETLGEFATTHDPRASLARRNLAPVGAEEER